jgi:WD40-like Beta Propeller Repeat
VAVAVAVVVASAAVALVPLNRRPPVELQAGSRRPKPGNDSTTSTEPTTATTGPTTTTTGSTTDVQTVATTGPRPTTSTVPKPKPKPTSTTTTAPSGPLGPGIYVMGTDGSRPRLIVKQPTSPGLGQAQPLFSPDGTYIAYVDDKTLHVTDLNGTDRVVGPGSEPAWSADSAHLAYTGPGDAGSGASDIWVADTADPTRPRPLRTPGDDSSPTWSPDGRLASVSEFGLFISDDAGGGRTRVVDEPMKGGLVAWSPDGSTLFLSAARHLALLKPDGTNQRIIISDDPYFVVLGVVRAGEATLAVSQRPVVWSADSRHVLITAEIGARSGAWVISVADGTAAFVADDVNDARVSPDGTRVAGYRFQGGSPTPAPLVSWRTDGSDRREILAPPADLTVTGLDWAPDGKSLAVNLATWLPLGGPGQPGPSRPTDSGAACGTPAGPGGYDATTAATAGGTTVRLDVRSCPIKPGEMPTIVATVDTPWTMITSAHIDFGDGTSRDVSYPTSCNRDGGSIMVPNPDHTTDYVTAPVGNTTVGDNAHNYGQPGRYQVAIAVTVVTCSAWDNTGQPGPSHVVTVTMPVERLSA